MILHTLGQVSMEPTSLGIYTILILWGVISVVVLWRWKGDYEEDDSLPTENEFTTYRSKWRDRL